MPRRSFEKQRTIGAIRRRFVDRRVQAQADTVRMQALIDERKRALITACVAGNFDVSTASSRAGDAALTEVRA